MNSNQTAILKALELEKINAKMTYGELKKRSLGQLMAYLKHSHVIFIKEYLPYIGILIDKLKGPGPLIKDLKLVFPLFFEDFVFSRSSSPRSWAIANFTIVCVFFSLKK